MNSPYLKRIFASRIITIQSTDGHDVIAREGKLFSGYLPSSFGKHYGINIPSRPTEKQEVQLFRLVRRASWETVFDGFNKNLGSLFFEQSQAISFVRNYRRYIPKNGTLMIPFRSDGRRFMLEVNHGSQFKGLVPNLTNFYRGGILSAGSDRRFVIPDLGVH
jgi:hypothetical protein